MKSNNYRKDIMLIKLGMKKSFKAFQILVLPAVRRCPENGEDDRAVRDDDRGTEPFRALSTAMAAARACAPLQQQAESENCRVAKLEKLSIASEKVRDW